MRCRIALGAYALYLLTDVPLPVMMPQAACHVSVSAEEGPESGLPAAAAGAVTRGADAASSGADKGFPAAYAEAALPACADIPVIRTLQMPASGGTLCGVRGSTRYYRGGDYSYAVTYARSRQRAMLIAYRPDFSQVRIYINDAHFHGRLFPADELLLLFPTNELMMRLGQVQLHASRIRVAGRAIVFSAPPGTGKTTAARLWERYAGAKIVSNDRVIFRRTEEGFLTYSFLVDGNDPVESTEVLPAGAVVLLAQGAKNQISRLPVHRVLQMLMSQTPADPWDKQQKSWMLQQWAEFVGQIPVYYYACRPDEEAVRMLQERLRSDGVL